MAFLMKLSKFFLKTAPLAEGESLFLKAAAVAGRESLVEMKPLTVYGRRFSETTQVDKEQKAMTNSFFLLLVIFLFLVILVGFVIVRRINRQLPLNNGNVESEQPDEERQMLIANATAAVANPGNELVVFQHNQPDIEVDHHDQAPRRRHCLYTLQAKYNLGTRLALVNFLMEIPSAVFDQMSSEKKPAYVLIVMLISLTSMLVCLVEFVYKGRKEKVTWMWSSGRMPWFYHPPPPSNRPFGTLIEIIGLVCAVAQCIISTINYSFCLRDHASPIKISVWPMIFSLGLLCSRLMGKPNEEGGESRTLDQDGGDIALNQAIVEPLTPAELQQ
ncbi:uncharacterized protein LOC111308167 [Durio zibethinus]|uniref:Uncharacterized protein LOC111308167 n=1 Tax=Durio zibethinus TaxID=66656 RepID=A0A6P6ABJ2_DURZI|nr:uncharacterized protein LOC111308167 [Durio zibethinus]